jgi:hypothetical protein
VLRSAALVLDDLKALPPDTFASRHIFESIPYVFKEDMAAYVSWKAALGEAIDVDPRSIAVVGSAGLGVSLNPDNNFSDFGPGSDVDVAVVSHHHFEAAWRFLRHVRVGRLSLTPEARQVIRGHGKAYVFDGTIATDFVLPYLPFGKEWLQALNSQSFVEPTVGLEVKARIYRDFDCLRDYQLKSVRLAQTHLGE